MFIFHSSNAPSACASSLSPIRARTQHQLHNGAVDYEESRDAELDTPMLLSIFSPRLTSWDLWTCQVPMMRQRLT